LRPEPFKLVLSCEHAGRQIPSEYGKLFSRSRGLLSTHRGHDIGAIELAETAARRFSAPLFRSIYTRLLVDLNRSVGSPSLFLEITGPLSSEQKADILRLYYRPYRDRIQKAVRSAIRSAIRSGGAVLHVSIHTFTPALKGKVRKTDVGILFDPMRSREKSFCSKWRTELARILPGLKIHFNLPYRGTSDGLTSELRKKWSDDVYTGIELEVNQKFYIGKNKSERNQFNKRITLALDRTLQYSF
jgi:predicted N-formylglutamate amidohydrolase